MTQAMELDEVIHQKTRLAIMAHLAATGEADFLGIRTALNLSDGNLSVHSSVLEEKGYIEIEKSFAGKKTRTTYRLTPLGRRAFADYVARLEGILRTGR